MKMKRVVKMPLRRTPPARLSPSSLRARTATADEVYEDEDYDGAGEPNMKFMHALLVVLILHVIAVAAIFAFNSIKARQTAEVKSSKSAPVAAAPVEKADPDTDQSVAAPVAAAATVEKPKPEAKPLAPLVEKSYTVKAGDTLPHIATLHGITVEALQKENGITYSVIRVGQVLKIPAAVKPVAAAKPAAPANAITAAPKTAAAPATEQPAVKPAAETPAPAAKTPASSADVYVVAKGDNPYSIAKKLHVSYNEMLTLNGIKDPTKIQIGQKLKLPPAKKN